MKKLNSKGFTLIELLAVITIMGILMMVAIPSVSRTIENSRRDTFADVAKTYVNTVRNAVLADELECNVGTGGTEDWKNVASMPIGTYAFLIDTGMDGADAAVKSQTEDLMESGGKSSWGNANVKGYVLWVKETKSTTGGDKTIKTSYFVHLVDDGQHGFAKTAEASVKRNAVLTSAQTYSAPASDVKLCRLR